MIGNPAGVQQNGIGRFIDGEPRGGQQQETAGRLQHRCVVIGKGEQLVAAVRDGEGAQPAADVGDQGREMHLFHQQDDGEEMDERGGTAPQDEDNRAVTKQKHGGFAWEDLRHSTG